MVVLEMPPSPPPILNGPEGHMHTSDSRLLPSPRPPSGWGWDAAVAEAQGNGDTWSLVSLYGPFLRLW